MSLRNYILGRVFLKQVIIALVILATLSYLLMHWLTYTTDHGHEITVPNLAKLTEEQLEEQLDALDLDYVILDSVEYNNKYPKYSVVEQDPLAGAKVKLGRKVYVKINSSGFSSVKIPNLIDKTYRELVPTLRALGLEEGTVTYVPNLGKDVVLEISCNGKVLKVGDRVLKASKIDLVLGDGKQGYVDDTEQPSDDELPAHEQ